VTLDAFHQPRALRYRRGELSAEGYYRDSFNYPALAEQCLVPFRRQATRIRVTSYDVRADIARHASVEVPARAVLLVDSVFLLRRRSCGSQSRWPGRLIRGHRRSPARRMG
jgi:uridine kinase